MQCRILRRVLSPFSIFVAFGYFVLFGHGRETRLACIRGAVEQRSTFHLVTASSVSIVVGWASTYARGPETETAPRAPRFPGRITAAWHREAAEFCRTIGIVFAAVSPHVDLTTREMRWLWRAVIS